MSVFKKIRGIIGDLFTLGIENTAHSIKDHTDGVEATNFDGTIRANAIVARPQGGNQDIHASTYLDTKERVIDVEFYFAGASAPAPGANTGKYGICHTSGLTFSAGQIYYDPGSVALTAVPSYKGMLCSPRANFTGTVSMRADDIYLAHSGTAPYTWTLIGGEAHESGEPSTVELSFGWASMGGTVSSTTAVPDGARVLWSTIIVDTPFSGGAAPKALLEVDGTGGDVTLQATNDNNLKVAHEYKNPATISVGATFGGPIRVTLTGTASAGAARALVQFCIPSA
jgi:hypothetical protein